MTRLELRQCPAPGAPACLKVPAAAKRTATSRKVGMASKCANYEREVMLQARSP
jgi:hypothetical protein